MKDNKFKSLHLVQKEKYAQILIRQFLKVHSFPWAAVLENYTLLETVNIRGQLCEYISNQMETIVYTFKHKPKTKQCSGC